MGNIALFYKQEKKKPKVVKTCSRYIAGIQIYVLFLPYTHNYQPPLNKPHLVLIWY